MAVTRLERKSKKNKLRAAQRQANIKQLNKKPVIKNVDIEEAKKGFVQKSTKKATTKTEA